MGTKTITIDRINGARVKVDVLDTTHYEVVIFHDSDDDAEVYERYELIAAPTAAVAKTVARGTCVDGEVVDTATKLTLGAVAVLMLHGAKVVA